MRLGCCGTLDQASALKDAGFDFLEVNVQQVLRGMEPSEVWDKAAPDPGKLPLPIEAANVLVPPELPVVGPKRDLFALQDYMQRIAKRAERLGIQRLVFGSGAARKRPEGFDPRITFEQLAEFCRMAGEVVAHHGILLTIEHLNHTETNTLNSLAECAALADRVDHPRVCVLVDSYHAALEHEEDEAIIALGNRVHHAHVAEPVNRAEPGAHGPFNPEHPHRQAYDFAHFFCLLRKIGYDERVSVEGKWSRPIPEAGPVVVKLLRDAWSEASKCECG